MQDRITHESARKRFADMRDQVVALLEQSVAVAEEVVPLLGEDGTTSLPDTFRERARQVREKEFVIVVVGELNRGKSALLNAMMGRHVLTMDVLECTATVNFLRQPKPGAPQSSDEVVVHFNDGRAPETVSVGELKKYTSKLSDLGRDKVADLVNHVDVFVESRFLEDNVVLVDTPGTNTTTAKHLQITADQIDRSHAALFVVKAQTQLTRSDKEFLEDVHEDVARIFVVVNMIDQVAEGDLGRVLERVEEKVRSAVGDRSAIHGVYGVSAAKAMVGRTEYAENVPEGVLRRADRSRLTTDPDFRSDLVAQSKIEVFESALDEYLFRGDKARDQLFSPVSFVQGEAGRLDEELRRQLDVIDGRFDMSDLELQVQKIERVIADRKHELDGITGELARKLSEALSKVEEVFKEKRKDAEASLLDEIRAYGDSYEALENNWADGSHFATLPGRKAIALQHQTKRMMEGAVSRVLRQADRNMRDRIREELGEISLDLPNLDEFEAALPELKIKDETARKIQAQIQAISKKIKANERKLTEMSTSYRSKEDYEEAKEERDRLLEQHALAFQQLGSRPGARFLTDIERRRERRKGLIGAIGNVLIGEKVVLVPIHRIDDQEGRAYDERRDRIEEQKREKLNDVERRIAKARKSCNADRLEELRSKRRAEVTENCRQELERLEKQQRTNRQDDERRAVAAAHGQLMESFRSAADALETVVTDHIDRTNMAEEFLAKWIDQLDAFLRERQQELQRLKALKDEQESERDASRERIGNARQQLKGLQDEASRLNRDGAWTVHRMPDGLDTSVA